MKILEPLIPSEIPLPGEAGPAEEMPPLLDELMSIALEVTEQSYGDASLRVDGLRERFPVATQPSFRAMRSLMLWQEGQKEAALAEAVAGIEHLESMARDHRVEETLTALLDQVDGKLFGIAVDQAATLGRQGEAFELAERGRAWGLRRLLGAHSEERIEASPVSPEEVRLLQEIHEKELELREGSGIPEELESLRGSFGRARLRRKLLTASESSLGPLEEFSLARLQQELLGPGQVMLSYFLANSKLWVWAVDGEGIEMAPVAELGEGNGRDLACEIQALRRYGSPPLELFRGSGSEPKCEPLGDPGEALGRSLLEPVVGRLRGKKHLIIVPSDQLHYLPFGALRNPDTGRLLIEDFTLSLAPSAGALDLVRRVPKEETGGALVLGDSESPLGPLSGARKEAMAVAQALGARAFLGEDASEARLKASLRGARVLHLAVHGELMADNPLFSRLWLGAGEGEDGRLEVHEIWDRLRLEHNQLVVLSGCQTALGGAHRRRRGHWPHPGLPHRRQPSRHFHPLAGGRQGFPGSDGSLLLAFPRRHDGGRSLGGRAAGASGQ